MAKWGVDEEERGACFNALFRLSADLAQRVHEWDLELKRLREWQRALRRLEVRHKIVLTLSLIQRDEDGALVQREEYEYKADGEARRYPRGERFNIDGEWRTATAQGMPNDLRAKLLGWRFRDKDGRASDPTIYVILAYKLGLPFECVSDRSASTSTQTSRGRGGTWRWGGTTGSRPASSSGGPTSSATGGRTRRASGERG